MNPAPREPLNQGGHIFELHRDTLTLQFPDVHEDARFTVDFQRTLRIPDDGSDYDERSPWRLLGALLAEQHELWITGRRWLAMDDYWEWKKKRETGDLDRAA